MTEFHQHANQGSVERGLSASATSLGPPRCRSLARDVSFTAVAQLWQPTYVLKEMRQLLNQRQSRRDSHCASPVRVAIYLSASSYERICDLKFIPKEGHSGGGSGRQKRERD